ncbi:MAG: ABC transporter substrate-binding protein [Clostridia bacterium]|nr:ABC transporter substrate-binding protein [Clostridia bacterium]
MKRIFSLLLVFLFLFTLGACKPNDTETLREVRVNEVTHSVFYAPFYAAMELGYFEEEGLSITLTNGGGSDKSMTALLTGDADVGLMGPETAVYVANEGREDYAVIFAQLTQRDGSFLLGKTPDDAFTWDKLEGTSVIGGRSGGMPQMTLDYVLRQKGLIPGENITVRTDVQFDLMGGAFIAGEDDYVTMFEPSASAMELAGEGYIVAAIGDEGGEVPYTCFMTAKSVLETDPDFVEAFTRAVYRGQKWIEQTSADEIAKVIAPQFPDSDEALLATVVERYRDIDAWKTEPTMTEEAYENLLTIIRAAGVIDSAPAYTEIVDNSFAQAVK